LDAAWATGLGTGGFEGVTRVMELAVCYDHSSLELAWSIFLDITAVFLIMAAFAAMRLIALSGKDPVERFQPA
ncbi:hypothetical protein, partial [Mesorhizobium sp. M1D.F.Ca.ET.183.01.1.1]|uniref:hypothetical protein n=2 Tax=Mesorhizobium TaxID=68287 RepID=UPI001AEEDE9B